MGWCRCISGEAPRARPVACAGNGVGCVTGEGGAGAVVGGAAVVVVVVVVIVVVETWRLGPLEKGFPSRR